MVVDLLLLSVLVWVGALLRNLKLPIHPQVDKVWLLHDGVGNSVRAGRRILSRQMLPVGWQLRLPLGKTCPKHKLS